MKKSTLARDIIGTALMFLFLVVVTAVLIYGEHLLDNFKTH